MKHGTDDGPQSREHTHTWNDFSRMVSKHTEAFIKKFNYSSTRTTYNVSKYMKYLSKRRSYKKDKTCNYNTWLDESALSTYHKFFAIIYSNDIQQFIEWDFIVNAVIPLLIFYFKGRH